MDNISELCNIRRLGDTQPKVLVELAKGYCYLCRSQQAAVIAKYLLALSIKVADWKSLHVSNTTDWKLDLEIV